MDEIEIRQVGFDDPGAIALAAAHVRAVDALYPDLDVPPAPPLAALLADGDRLLVAYRDGAAVGVAAVRRLDPATGELKRMFVAERARGLGIGRRLLVVIEDHARELGCERVVLDTGRRQIAALALYRSAGYVEIADYNNQPGADHWFEKRL